MSILSAPPGPEVSIKCNTFFIGTAIVLRNSLQTTAMDVRAR
jgi:hypothetical protein